MHCTGRRFIYLVSLLLVCSCSRDYMEFAGDKPLPMETNFIDGPLPSGNYKTKNVIILVIDGPRFSETWGDPSHSNIPVLSKRLSRIGVVNTAFYNFGPTYTNAGHTAITTGNYQEIQNGGQELPRFPSIFQHWSKTYDKDSTASFVIASKDKLSVLADTENSLWKGKFRPSTDCGMAGLGSGYRNDADTYERTFAILAEGHPNLVLINLKDPDWYGHSNDWDNYVNAIHSSDAFLGKLWDFLRTNEFYADTTTLFMTNDHGRHGDDIKNGFISHGDSCPDCRHINLFATGPDFKQNMVLEVPRSQIDIASTVAELLRFEMPYAKGEIMYELFRENKVLVLTEPEQ